MIYYVYPVGSKTRRAKTSKRWKAAWYVFALHCRELKRWLLYGVPMRGIITETHKNDTMYNYGTFK